MGIRSSFFLALAVALVPLPAAAAEQPSPLDEVIAAERAFAAETRARGFRDGFLAWVAPDGFTFEPGPAPARPRLEAMPDGPEPGPPLFWWPQYAGVAQSGDLGFTTGGATVPLRYFTVWQRQADGGWKWLYDGGARLAAPLPGGENDPVVRLPLATAAAGSVERAMAEVAALEAEVARLAAGDAVAARRSYLSADGLVAGSPAPAFPGRAHHEAELARQPAHMAMRPAGAVASRAGDLAFTWGEVRWRRGETPRWGHYARIWQNRTEGWRIVADILVAAPGLPPDEAENR